MTTRRPAAVHQNDRKTVHIGRVGAHTPWADWSAAGGQGEQEPGEGRGRRPARGLVIGLLLAVSLVLAAGVAAFAMGSTPAPAPGVSGSDVPAADTPATVGAGAALSTAPTRSVQVPASSLPAPAATVPGPAVSVPGPFFPAGQGAVDPPATVSTLASGDPGFGWPSSAFGIAP